MMDINNPEIVQIVISNDEQTVWVNTERGCVFRAERINQLLVDDRRGEQIVRDPVLVWLEMKKTQAEDTHKRMISLEMPHVGRMVPKVYETLIGDRQRELQID